MSYFSLNDTETLRGYLSSKGSLSRRRWLESTGILLGASALPPGGSLLAESGRATPNNSQTTPIGRRMIGFMLAHEQFPVPELVELGADAEQAGFQLLATSDHFQPWQDNEAHSGLAWVTMSAIGQRSRHAWMGTTVTCPTFRYNPAVVAEAFASLSLLYPGRIFLGLGSGEALNEEAATGEWPKWQERSDRLIEATELIRELWKGNSVHHKGKFYPVDARLYDTPAASLPILMAANGLKAMRRAGQYGDGLITDPKTLKDHRSEFDEAARAAGKDPKKMPILAEAFVVVGGESEAKQAAELWRFIPKAFKTYYNVASPQAIRERAEAELPLEKVYGDWTVSTDPAAHAKAITELFHNGATIVNVHSGQTNQKQIIRFYGEKVLPLLKKELAA